MTIESSLLDLGNVLFTIGCLPQIYTTFKNRHSLKDINYYSQGIFTISTAIFVIADLYLGAYIALTLCSFNIFANIWNIYWSLKNRGK